MLQAWNKCTEFQVHRETLWVPKRINYAVSKTLFDTMHNSFQHLNSTTIFEQKYNGPNSRKLACHILHFQLQQLSKSMTVQVQEHDQTDFKRESSNVHPTHWTDRNTSNISHTMHHLFHRHIQDVQHLIIFNAKCQDVISIVIK